MPECNRRNYSNRKSRGGGSAGLFDSQLIESKEGLHECLLHQCSIAQQLLLNRCVRSSTLMAAICSPLKTPILIVSSFAVTALTHLLLTSVGIFSL